MNVMLEDSYPAVRRIASRSLTHLFADASERTQAILRDYNPEGTVEARAETIQALQTLLGEHAWIAPDRAWVAQLRRRAANVNIEIGE
jgi:hypothetical protein